MQVDHPDKLRNIAVTGHNATGKTTLVSACLYTSGMVDRFLRVEDGNTVTDFDPEEVERGISIGLAPCYLSRGEHKLNLLDCPGTGLFQLETASALTAADSVVLCVDPVSGVEVTTERVWQQAAELELPVLVHLNKMDREHADFERALGGLQDKFGREVVAIQVPLRGEQGFEGTLDLVSQKALRFERDGDGAAAETEFPEELKDKVEKLRDILIEAVAETEDALMERFFENGTLTDDELRQGLKRAVQLRKLFPVTVGSALHNVGTETLLQAVVDLLPAPSDRSGLPAQDGEGGEEIGLDADPEGPLAALVFKTLSDPFTGKISIVRVASGTLSSSDSTLYNVRTGDEEKMGQLLLLQGRQGSTVERVLAGDIAGIAKLKGTRTGDTLSTKARPIRLRSIDVPAPVISFAIEPKSKGDEEKIGDALQRLMEEDLSLQAGRDPQTGEFLLSGTGQLHVEIAVARLKKRFNVEVILHPPKVPYRETILKAAEGHGRHKKQTGGRGQFADCKIVLEPLERGKDFEFVDEIFGGAIPQGFRPAVEKGIQETRQKGYLAGYPVVDFRVRLVDGQYHDVDSSEIAFKIAGALAFKEAMAKARPSVLEPIMKVQIFVDDEFTGDVISDLAQRRGKPQGMDSQNGSQIINAVVPMAEMLTYARSLRAITQGRGNFHMEFSHYEEVPQQVQEKLIADSRSETAHKQEA